MTEKCNIHNIEKIERHENVPELDEYGEIIFDADGIPVMLNSIIYECPKCEEERLRQSDIDFYEDSAYEAMDILKESISETEKNYPQDKTYREKENREDFITTYSPIIARLTDAPLEAARAMMQFHIACSLVNAKYVNSKGQIFPNLSFIWIAPSASNKTPLIDLTIEKIQSDIYPDFKKFGALTGKGFRQSLAKIKKKREIVKQPVLVIWDEASTMSKDVKNEATSDLYEVLSEAYDGKLSNYTSVRGGDETYPKLYTNIWASGVPSFLENTDRSFWYQGFGLRSLFLQYSIVPISDISDEGEDEIKNFYRQLEADLTLMKSITKVKTTKDFMIRYNEYRREVLLKIQEVQRDILKAQDPDIFPIISKGKYPVLMMKLAMIHAASRWNFTEHGVLTLEREDLERAINDLEQYHDNLVQMFNVWQELVETKSRMNNIKNMKDKIKRHINSIAGSGKGFILERDDFEGESIYIAEMSKDGTWVPHASLLKMSHMTSKDFSEIVTTLQEQLMIQKRDGIIIKNGIKHAVTFYSLL